METTNSEVHSHQTLTELNRYKYTYVYLTLLYGYRIKTVKIIVANMSESFV